MAAGRCLCGSVRFDVQPPWRWFAHCHCSICRKHHGALFSTSLGVHATRFRWAAGKEHAVRYRASPAFERPFCRRCGSKLPAATQRSGLVNVPAGTLDGDLGGSRPRTRIFAASKAACDVIADALPRFDAYPPGTGTEVEPPRPRSAPVGRVVGGCACGTAEYEIAGSLERLIHNHGVGARRSRGAAYATDAVVAADRLEWVRGAEALETFVVDAPGALTPLGRFAVTFCRRCGALLPSPLRAGATSEGARGAGGITTGGAVVVPLGSVDSAIAAACAVHVHVAGKASWFDIEDSLPRFERACFEDGSQSGSRRSRSSRIR